MSVKLVFCLRRRPGLSLEAFQETWLNDHGPLVRRLRERLPAMKHYVQSHTVPGPETEALRASRNAAPAYDGITEVWLDSLEDVADSSEAAVEAARQLLEDERRFLDLPRCSIFLTVEHEIF